MLLVHLVLDMAFRQIPSVSLIIRNIIILNEILIEAASFVMSDGDRDDNGGGHRNFAVDAPLHRKTQIPQLS